MLQKIIDEDALDKTKKLGLLVIYGNVIPQWII